MHAKDCPGNRTFSGRKCYAYYLALLQDMQGSNIRYTSLFLGSDPSLPHGLLPHEKR